MIMRNISYLVLVSFILLNKYCISQVDTVSFKLCESMFGKKKDIRWNTFFIQNSDTIQLRRVGDNVFFVSFCGHKFLKKGLEESSSFILFENERYFYKIDISSEDIFKLNEFCIEPKVNRLFESSFYYRIQHIYASGLVLRRKKRK